jgi:glucose/arabinose dehydrogenase
MKSILIIIRCVMGIVLLLSSCSPVVTPALPDTNSAPPASTSTLPDSTQPVPLPTAVESIAHSTSTAVPPVNPQPTAPVPSQFPDPAGYAWKLITGAFDRPAAVVNAGDGSGRLFVLEQSGVIRVVNGGQIEPTPFLDISDRVGSRGNEQGLLGIAFHPNYSQNGFFFLDYTDTNGNTVIARFTAPPGNNSDPSSEKVILQIKQPFPNHNGGQIVFGPDHYLWIGMGDGGSQGDPNNNAQSVNALLGKILRIDVDHGSLYAIPKDNPFATGGGRPEIYAYGLRNPWRFSIDSETGDLFVADVGQNSWEEIDYLPAGYNGQAPNFGWNRREGLHPYNDSDGADMTGLIDPIFEYGHDQGCSVTGGFVYRGKNLPAFNGIYLFADYCSGIVWGLIRSSSNTWEGQILFNTGYGITSFGEDQNGEIYLLDQKTGLYRLEVK